MSELSGTNVFPSKGKQMRTFRATIADPEGRDLDVTYEMVQDEDERGRFVWARILSALPPTMDYDETCDEVLRLHMEFQHEVGR